MGVTRFLLIKHSLRRGKGLPCMTWYQYKSDYVRTLENRNSRGHCNAEMRELYTPGTGMRYAAQELYD